MSVWLVERRDRSWLWRPVLDLQRAPDVDVEQNFVDIGDIELPDDDSVQCGSEFDVICNNELSTEQR